MTTNDRPAVERAREIERLRVKLTGSGSVHVCRHPDVDDMPVDHAERTCVLDLGRPGDCDIVAGLKGRDKTKCEFWSEMMVVEPIPLTINEGLFLLSVADAAPRDGGE